MIYILKKLKYNKDNIFSLLYKLKMSYAIYNKEYFENTENVVTDTEFYESIAKIRLFLEHNKEYIERDEYKDLIRTIPTEVCIHCQCVYFHNYNDCGIEEGYGNYGEWICDDCQKKCRENGLFELPSEREITREITKSELQISEMNEENEVCSICLDELRICEGVGEYEQQEVNITLPCEHQLCRCCYYKMSDDKCPLCRAQFDKL
jgi:hypothetical protein